MKNDLYCIRNFTTETKVNGWGVMFSKDVSYDIVDFNDNGIVLRRYISSIGIDVSILIEDSELSKNFEKCEILKTHLRKNKIKKIK